MAVAKCRSEDTSGPANSGCLVVDRVKEIRSRIEKSDAES